MSHFKLGNTVLRVASTASSGGTLTLTNASFRYQQITGTANHTVVLPDTTTLPKGWAFIISNRSTGTVTVNYNGGSNATTLNTNTQKTFLVFDNVTAIGDWDISNEAVAGSGGSVTSGDKLSALANLGSSNYKDAENTARLLPFMAEEIGGTFWETKTSMPSQKQDTCSDSLNGYGYVPGGNAGGPDLTSTFRYDDDNNYWLTRGVLNTARSTHGCFALGNFLYVAGGGSGITSVEKYDDSANTWAAVANLGTGVGNPGSFGLSDYGIVVGGINGGSYIATTQMYDAVADAWYNRANYNDTLDGRANGVNVNGNGYVFGSRNNATTLIDPERYFKEENYWLTVKTMNSPTIRSAVASMNGLGYCFGGNTSNTVNQEYYDYLNYWLNRSALPTGIGSTSAFSLNGQAYIAGTGGVATVQRYNNSRFVQSSIVKKTSLSPTSIFISTTLNDAAVTSGIRVRTDGNTWKYADSNKDKILKQGQSVNNKLVPTPYYYTIGGFNGGTVYGTNEFYNDQQNTWTSRQAISTARHSGASIAISAGLGYYITGSTVANSPSGNVTTNERYDDLVNAWTSRTAITTSRIWVGAFALDGSAYVAGGQIAAGPAAVATVEKYSETLNSWSSVASLSSARIEMGSCAFLGHGYVSGANAPGVSAIHDRYNAITDAWTNRTSLPAARAAASDFVIYDKKYTCGGINGGFQSSVYEYDQQTDAFVTKTSLNTSRRAGSPASVGGYGYIGSGTTSSAVTEKFDPLANTWTNVASLSVARDYLNNHSAGPYRNYDLQIGLSTYLTAVGSTTWIARASLPASKRTYQMMTINGNAYSAGGFDGAESALNDRYNTHINTWTRDNSRPLAAYEIGNATLLGFGYSTGGFAPGESTGHYQFNAEAHSWTSKSSISPANASLRLTALGGFLYRSGGRESSVGVNTHQVYSPAADTWTSKAGMNTARGFVTMIHNPGFIMAIGGQNAAATKQSSTEIYNDATNVWLNKASISTAKNSMGCGSSKAITGIVGGDTGSLTAVVEYYNWDANTWANKTNYPASYTVQGGADLGDSTLFAGGHDGSSQVANVWLSSPALSSVLVGAGLRVTES